MSDLVKTSDGYMKPRPAPAHPFVGDFLTYRERITAAGCIQTEGVGEGYYCQQNADEIGGLVAVLKRYGPFAEMLDIGIGSGGTTRFLAESLDIGKVTVVDDFSQDRCEHWERNRHAIKQPVTEVKGDTKDIATWEALRATGKTFDLVGIDACHTADYVANDWRLAFGQLKIGSIVWFHDINLPDVQIVWAHVSTLNPVIYRCTVNQVNLGIGAIMFLNGQPS